MAKTKWKINYKNLQEFIDINKTKDKLTKLNTSKLNDKEKLAVETFLRDFDKKDKSDDFE